MEQSKAKMDIRELLNGVELIIIWNLVSSILMLH